MITKEALNKSLTFNNYFNLTEEQVKNKDTSGENKSEALVDYTKLNFSRMKRILKTTQVNSEVVNYLSNINKPIYFVVFTETWCGDAAQNIPVFFKLAETNSNIKLRLLFRDEHPKLMENYLTNGGKAIPKLVALDEDLNELGTWGPRPAFLQNWLKKEKENPTMSMDDLKQEFQVWYTKDKGATLQAEMVDLIKKWQTKKVII